MIFYLDFDSTLFHTKNFTKKMLNSIAVSLTSENSSLNKDEIYSEAQSLFNRDNIYNIYKLADFLAEKYNVNKEIVRKNLHLTIEDGKEFVFDDVVPFLEKIKKNNNVVIFTYSTKDSFSFQLEKIYGSGLADYFDDIFITDKQKHELNLDYQNAVFVDDNNEVLEGLYSVHPKKLYRIRREGTKYYNAILPENLDIPEIFSLNEIDY